MLDIAWWASTEYDCAGSTGLKAGARNWWFSCQEVLVRWTNEDSEVDEVAER